MVSLSKGFPCMAQDGVLICEVWSLKMFWPIYVFSLYLWILFYQPFYPYKWPSCPLKISLTLSILRKVFTQYYLLIYILLSLLFLVSHLLENWKKIHLQNPLNKYEFSSNSFSFSSMSLSRFFVFLNKTTQEKS